MPNVPTLPTPHGEKMTALAANTKAPAADAPRIQVAIQRYQQWRADILAVSGTRQQVVPLLVAKLNEYKRYIELELIFDTHIRRIDLDPLGLRFVVMVEELQLRISRLALALGCSLDGGAFGLLELAEPGNRSLSRPPLRSIGLD